MHNYKILISLIICNKISVKCSYCFIFQTHNEVQTKLEILESIKYY